MKFKPKQGQVDFTNARWAPVINCVVKYKDKILLVKRSDKLRLYPNCWNGISGFLDDNKSLEQKVKQELKEEIGIAPRDIIKIILGEIFYQEAPKYKKTWIVHPVLVEVATDKIKLDWEAEHFKWLTPCDSFCNVLGRLVVIEHFFDTVLQSRVFHDFHSLIFGIFSLYIRFEMSFSGIIFSSDFVARKFIMNR